MALGVKTTKAPGKPAEACPADVASAELTFFSKVSTFKNDYGVTISVSGPLRDDENLEQATARLLDLTVRKHRELDAKFAESL